MNSTVISNKHCHRFDLVPFAEAKQTSMIITAITTQVMAIIRKSNLGPAQIKIFTECSITHDPFNYPVLQGPLINSGSPNGLAPTDSKWGIDSKINTNNRQAAAPTTDSQSSKRWWHLGAGSINTAIIRETFWNRSSSDEPVRISTSNTNNRLLKQSLLKPKRRRLLVLLAKSAIDAPNSKKDRYFISFCQWP